MKITYLRGCMFPSSALMALFVLATSTASDGEENAKDDTAVAAPALMPSGTDLIPHLHGKIVPGRNCIYSAGFQLAWNALMDRHADSKPMIGAESELAAFLNRREIEAKDVAPGSVVVGSGWLHEGVLEKIRREMAEKFPESRVRVPDIEWKEGDPPRFHIHAHLEKNLSFRHHFMPIPETNYTFVPEDWHAARIDKVPVRAFGNEYVNHPAIKQVVIHHFGRSKKHDRSDDRFVVELKTESADTELLLACVPPMATMSETLQEIGRLREGQKLEREKAVVELKRHGSLPEEERRKIPYEEYWALEQRVFDCRQSMDYSYDSLVVPVLAFDLQREYDELIGLKTKELDASGNAASIAMARQTLTFRLDEKGVKFSDDSDIAEEEENGVVGRMLHFTRPFLVVVNERANGKPVFAAWIGNAELLEWVGSKLDAESGRESEPITPEKDPFADEESEDKILPPL